MLTTILVRTLVFYHNITMYVTHECLNQIRETLTMFASQTLFVNSQLLYRLSYRGIKLYKEQISKYGYYT